MPVEVEPRPDDDVRAALLAALETLPPTADAGDPATTYASAWRSAGLRENLEPQGP